jgi:TolB-like protein
LSVAALAISVWISFHRESRRTAEVPNAGVLASIPEKSIAVLPFENFSTDKENAFFADGIHDEVLTYLAKVADLKVISRTSVMQYKNAAMRNVREIAPGGECIGRKVQRSASGKVNKIADDASNRTHV